MGCQCLEVAVSLQGGLLSMNKWRGSWGTLRKLVRPSTTRQDAQTGASHWLAGLARELCCPQRCRWKQKSGKSCWQKFELSVFRSGVPALLALQRRASREDETSWMPELQAVQVASLTVQHHTNCVAAGAALITCPHCLNGKPL